MAAAALARQGRAPRYRANSDRAPERKARSPGKILAGEIQKLHGLTLAVETGQPRNGDLVVQFDPDLKPEHYRLTVGDRAVVRAGDYNDAAWGTVTLLQALRKSNGQIVLPRITVDDYPQLDYSATMFDIARFPYSIETLKQCADIARFYKIRYIHLHMSDDNAWVFPSTAYPQLGEHNAVRWPARHHPNTSSTSCGVDRLWRRPGRELRPGDGNARPQRPTGRQSAGDFAAKDDDGKPLGIGMINFTNERAYEAIDTLVGEICDVFKSSPYFHTGGDEVVMANLNRCPDIKAFAAKHELKSLHEVINPFQARLRDIVVRHGKQMIAWDGASIPPAAAEGHHLHALGRRHHGRRRTGPQRLSGDQRPLGNQEAVLRPLSL